MEDIKDAQPPSILELHSLLDLILCTLLFWTFENSNVRLPPVTEGIECSLSRPDFRHNEIVMDFQNSRAYMLCEKRGVINIVPTAGFMSALSGRSDIMNDVVSNKGCQCSFPTFGNVVTPR
uniref:Uncharacterized protein n=1 Tax=Tanacetum cinerariifolium TaxID=118510 RepID=A0A699S3P9_TANCI|nr:hypothetical protein [Tanacetum cinerariifolium]